MERGYVLVANFLSDRTKDKKRTCFKWIFILVVILSILLIFFFTMKTYELLPGDNLVETASAAEDKADENKVKEMREISDSVSKAGVGADENAGNQWAALGADSSFFASFTKATERVTYEDLKKRGKKYGIAGSYGFVLDQSGLDHSFIDGDSGAIFSTLGRLFFGGVIMFGYILQGGINYLFSFITTIADYINVFKWFTSAEVDENAPFAGVHKIVYSIVSPLQSVGIVVLTFLFVSSVALAILGWRVSSRNPRTGVGTGLLQSVGKLLMRFFIMLLAPLLLATIFSSLMTATKDAYSGSSASDYAVYSNLIDFDKWVKHSRLALPKDGIEGLNYGLNAGKVGYVTHKDILNINADSAALNNARDTRKVYEPNRVGTAIGIQGQELSEAKDKSVNDWAMSIVSKWTRLETVTSATYESYARNQYLSGIKDANAANSGGSPEKVDDDEYEKALKTDGFLDVKEVGSDEGKTVERFVTNKPNDPIGDDKNDAVVGSSTGAGLSSLGMYNFLSTTFDSNSFTFTRTDLMVGKAFTPYHASVGLAGRGIVALGNYSIMFATVYSIAILGLMFAMFAINALIVSVPKAIGALTGSMFGSIKNFIKMMMVVFVLAIELVGGAILYLVSQKIIVGVSMLGDGIAGKGTEILMKAPDNVALASGMSNTLYGTINVVIAMLLLVVMFMLIRYRGKILGGFASTFEGAINNLFGMFESTQEGSQAFQGGKNGMYTTNEEGKNQFSRPDGSSTEFSRKQNEEGATGGASTFNKGAQSRSSGVANPKSLLGKAVNAKAGIEDAIRAKETELGRPLTTGEKRKEVAKQGAIKAGAGAIRTVGGVVGSNKLAGVGDDMDSARQAKINNSLVNAERIEQEVQELAKGSASGDQGETQDIKDINAYADAQMTSTDTNMAVEKTAESSINEAVQTNSSSIGTTGMEENHVADSKLEESNAINQQVVDSGNQEVNSSAVGAVASMQDYATASSNLAATNNELAKAQASGNEANIESARAKQNVAQAKVQESQVASAVAGEQYVNKAKQNASSAQSVEQAAKSKLQNALNNPDIATQEEVSQMKQDVKQAEQHTVIANNAVKHAEQLQQAVVSRGTNQPIQQRTSGATQSVPQTKANGVVQKSSKSPNTQSNPLPSYSSTKASNDAVKQAQMKYNQVKQQASVAPIAQREAMQMRVQQANKNLKHAQAGASKYFENQPAIGLAQSNLYTRNPDKVPMNKQARAHLTAIRDAHMDFRKVTQMSKPTPGLVKEAKMRLENAKQVAVNSGMRKESINGISAIKQNLDQLNQSQTEFISGTGDEFITESIKTKMGEAKHLQMTKAVSDFKYDNFK